MDCRQLQLSPPPARMSIVYRPSSGAVYLVLCRPRRVSAVRMLKTLSKTQEAGNRRTVTVREKLVNRSSLPGLTQGVWSAAGYC